ncbi:Nucleotidyltransferase YcgL [Planctomycetales bacterium 10988]|nr:Nucleotidyltransferase YcgL [Planctomycetales bacterium 10988]
MKTEEQFHLNPVLKQTVEDHPYPLLFVTVSGSHLYGFPSPDSDFDLRGIHILPIENCIGLKSGKETIEKSEIKEKMEIDLVTHDIKKFMGMMLKKNGYVLEQLMSPLIVTTSPVHDQLKDLSSRCITKFHAYHYLGFAATQWKLFQKDSPPRVKPLLYLFRVLLTGIHLMRTGRIEANLVALNEDAKLSYLPELIDRKILGHEKATLEAVEFEFYQHEYERLRKELEDEFYKTHLPEQSSAEEELNDLLVSLRLNTLA